MKLPEFMEAERLTQARLAQDLGVDQGTISRMLSRGTASVGLALKVEAYTDRKVNAETLSEEVAIVRRGGRAA